MGIMNGLAWLRLEFIVYNGHYNLTFESWGGDKLGLRLPVFNTKIVSVGTLPLMLWHLDGPNVSSWV